jgi:hypothetical protein
MFSLAGHLGMTVGELSTRMDSRELTEWIAYTRYFEALPDQWEQTGLVVASLLAPYAKEGRSPKARDFVPLTTPPQHESQDREAIYKLKAALGE